MGQKILLWVDDKRNPMKDNWLSVCPIGQPFKTVWVKSYIQFARYIKKNGLPDAICFDHDLGDTWRWKVRKVVKMFSYFYDDMEDREYTGMDCAKWLVNYCMDNDCSLPEYNSHSSNHGGNDNIIGLLDNFQYVSQIP